MISRRELLVAGSAALLGVAPLSAIAQRKPSKKKRIDVVKIISFGCPLSRASDATDHSLRTFVEDLGGQFVVSPYPVEIEAKSAQEVLSLSSKERVFYASRKKGAVISEKVKSSLFKGSQDMGLPLTTYMDVYTWLNQDIPDYSASFADIFLHAQEPATGESVKKVAYLAQQSGARSLPAYVVIVDGKILPAMGPDDIQGGSLTRLRDSVKQSISNQLKKETR